MRIIEEDLVDWEPLHMRFSGALQQDDRDSLVVALEEWFKTNATETADCDIRYWRVGVDKTGTVEAYCEHLTRKALKRLARYVSQQCPQIDEIVLGEHIEGYPSGLTFDWFLLPDAEVSFDEETHSVKAVAISLLPVTVGQFMEFMEKTGYIPVPDRLEYEGYLISHFQLNFGKSPKLPLFGVTHDDAVAYCEWASLRLPAEPELHHFFVSLINEGRSLDWSGECWTATSPRADTYIARNGPYSMSDSPVWYRKELHRHQYQFLEAPCFRVARTLNRAAAKNTAPDEDLP